MPAKSKDFFRIAINEHKNGRKTERNIRDGETSKSISVKNVP